MTSHVCKPNGTAATLIGRRAFLKVGAAALAAPAILRSGASRAAGKDLIVANWKGYGSDQDWAIAEFTKRTGATVTHQYYNSEQELLQLLRNGAVGQVDVALPNLMYTQPAINEGLIEPIDVGRLPNYKSLFPELIAATGGDKSTIYAIPYVWGMNSFFYNSTAISEKLDSWAALWDDKYKGQVAFVDDPTAAVFIAALYLKQDPYNPNLDDVQKVLIDLKQRTKMLYAADGDFIKAYLNKSVTLGQAYSSSIGSDALQKAGIVGAPPKEGAIGWADNWTIVKDAPNKDLAYAWIDYMISPEFQSGWAKTPDGGSPAPSSKAAVALLDKDTVTRLQATPELIPHLIMQKDVPQEKLSQWLDLWQAVKAS
jgi:spermidine/putrescine transport system substrate-binding protein